MSGDPVGARDRAGDPLPVVQDGRAAAVVVLADDPGPREWDAAQLLVDTIRRSTGVTLPMGTHASAAAREPDLTRLCVGLQERSGAASRDPDLSSLPGDGFVLRPGEQSLTMAGPSSAGTEFAVLEFLERFIGARWLMPGPGGADIPQHRDLVVRARSERHRPATRSRMIMGLARPDGLGGRSGSEWAHRNRMQVGPEFRHALWRLLPPERYARRFPQWYPPQADLTRRYGWQPRFSDPGTVSAAVEEILAHLERHPDEQSVSLAVNDYSGFHDADRAPGRRNSAGFLDASASYFHWVNQVAERVTAVHPGLRFGVLAYHDVLDPPDFALHPSVVPFITGDRVTWSDPALEDRGRRLTASWSERATELGWWEYLHGAGYLVPKVFFTQLAANYRFAVEHRVQHHFLESWPDWGGGPQMWIAMRLVWDPARDPDTLLEEWCERTAGTAGASGLTTYYRYWEQFWSGRTLATEWFARWRDASVRSDYLRFDDPSYLDAVRADDLGVARTALDGALRSTTSEQAQRVGLLHGKWRYYEAAIRYYQQVVSAPPDEVPETDQQAVSLLAAMEQRYREGEQVLALLHRITPDDALRAAAHLPTVLDRAGVQATFGPGAVAALVQWFRTGDRRGSDTAQALAALADGPPGDLSDRAQLIRCASEGEPGLFDNASFAAGLDGWDVGEPTAGRFETVPGRPALIARGVWSGGLSQTRVLRPGVYGLLLRFGCPVGTSTGTLQLVAEHRDTAGRRMRLDRSACTRVYRAAGGQGTLEWVFRVPSPTGTQPGGLDRVHRTRMGVEFTTAIEGASFPSMASGESIVLEEFTAHRLHRRSG